MYVLRVYFLYCSGAEFFLFFFFSLFSTAKIRFTPGVAFAAAVSGPAELVPVYRFYAGSARPFASLLYHVKHDPRLNGLGPILR